MAQRSNTIPAVRIVDCTHTASTSPWCQEAAGSVDRKTPTIPLRAGLRLMVRDRQLVRLIVERAPRMRARVQHARARRMVSQQPSELCSAMPKPCRDR
jgi:hypothetical protein